MRECLKELNIVGGVCCFREGEYCKQTIDWLCDFCDKVIILLDNYNLDTEQIILEYKEKFKNKINVIYSQESIIEHKNLIQGQIKKRFKIRQPYIREQVIQELHRVNKEKTVDIFIFLDSDELPINQFSKILETFWNERSERWIMAGFIEPFENFKTIIYQKMACHGRIFKYDSKMSALPYTTRTRYHPYLLERAWKIRNLILHLCHFDENRRKKRQFFDNTPWFQESMDYPVWQLPKDIREMTVKEIADYQFGVHGSCSKYPSMTLKEYLKNNKKNYDN